MIRAPPEVCGLGGTQRLQRLLGVRSLLGPGRSRGGQLPARFDFASRVQIAFRAVREDGMLGRHRLHVEVARVCSSDTLEVWMSRLHKERDGKRFVLFRYRQGPPSTNTSPLCEADVYM